MFIDSRSAKDKINKYQRGYPHSRVMFRAGHDIPGNALGEGNSIDEFESSATATL